MNESELQGVLNDACRRHNVPGASAAVFADDGLVLAASGVANVTTGVEMTTGTLMHIGSITKVINATLLMQLVEQGSVALEMPTVGYLPHFRVQDISATQAITVEMLVNHTAGIDADLLPDAGHDGETISRSVERLANVGLIHEPGRGRSYCNAGMVVAGHLCALQSDKSWYDLVKERIFGPLGMQQAAVLPEDAILQRVSVGHFQNVDGMRRTSHAFLPLGYAPAGSTAMMSANDLMTFVRAHLGDGIAPNGSRILSRENIARMRLRSGPIEGPEAFDSGLGWRLIGDLVLHGGGGPGIVSLVVAHPASQTAAVVLTNAEHGFAVIADVVDALFGKRGIEVFPKLSVPPEPQPVEGERYTGIYESINTVHEVEQSNGELTWASWSTQKYYDSSPMEKPRPVPLVAIGSDRFLASSRASTMPSSDTALISFVEPNERGKMRYLIENLWLFPRRNSGG